MKKIRVLLIITIGCVGLSFFYSTNDRFTVYHQDDILSFDSSVEPPPLRTGAPGEGNCTSCHSGIVNSADGVVDFTLSGGPGYIPGSTYPMTISSIGGPKNGFELVILDGDDNQAGTFTPGPDTDVITASGRQYIRHTVSEGTTTWNFTWEAPAEDLGELTAYYAVVKANNNGSSSGDEVFLGTAALPIFGTDIEENVLDKSYNVFYNTSVNELNLDYQLIESAKVVLSVRNLAGKHIQSYDFGNQKPGTYNETLILENTNPAGVYVLSLFIDNQVFNRKVFLG